LKKKGRKGPLSVRSASSAEGKKKKLIHPRKRKRKVTAAADFFLCFSGKERKNSVRKRGKVAKSMAKRGEKGGRSSRRFSSLLAVGGEKDREKEKRGKGRLGANYKRK